MKNLIILFLLMSSFTWANSLEDVKTEFLNGNLFKSLELLNKSNISSSNKKYWLGKIHLGLENYETSLRAFSEVRSKKILGSFEYLYDLAIVNYHLNNLQQSKELFRRCEKIQKRPYITYLVGDILRIQGSKKTATRYFKEVLQNDEASTMLKQAAAYQLGSLEEDSIRKVKNKKQFVESKVIPQYQRTIEFSDDSPISNQSSARISQLRNRFNLKSNQSNKRSSARLSQEFIYDSNILLLPDDISGAQAQNKDGVLSRTAIGAGYDLISKSKFVLNTDLNINYDRYFDRTNSTIFQNDAYNLNPSINASYKHTVGGKKAINLFSIEHNYRKQDYLAQKEFTYFSKNYSVMVGEILNVFKPGATIINLKFQRSYFYSNQLDNSRYSLNYTQFFNLNSQESIGALFGFDHKTARYDLFDSRMYYLTTFFKSPIFLKKLGLDKYSLKAGLSLLFIDFVEQSEIRGVEKNINPFFELSRKVFGGMDFITRYALRKNFSDEDNFNYTKHELSIGLAKVY